MYLFVMSLIAALVSGRLAWRFDGYRSTYLAVCVAASVTALVSGTQLIPETVWVAYTPHICGTLLVLVFWALRTQVRKMLLN